MISNRESKFIKSLELKKYRTQEGKFVVEGAKNVLELLSSNLTVESLFLTDSFLEKNSISISEEQYVKVKQKELEKISHFKTNNAALAVVDMPELPDLILEDQVTIALHKIKDPGNLGTIMRIADWYGWENIVCSPESVDCFNPKVIAASMGSFSRVKVYYQPIDSILDQVDQSFAADMHGKSIYETQFSRTSLLVFGNESHGLGNKLLDKVKTRVAIPGHGKAESLNVAVSAAIFCDNINRQLS